jgi:hypothetical protein
LTNSWPKVIGQKNWDSLKSHLLLVAASQVSQYADGGIDLRDSRQVDKAVFGDLEKTQGEDQGSFGFRLFSHLFSA